MEVVSSYISERENVDSPAAILCRVPVKISPNYLRYILIDMDKKWNMYPIE